MPLSDEQLAARRHRIGASDVAAIMGLSAYSNVNDVFASKTGRVPPFPGNAATDLGNRLEPAILGHAEDDLGEPLKRNVEVPLSGVGFPMVATLDGQRANGEPVEAKTAGLLNPRAKLTEWGDEGSNQIPAPYIVQVQSQMMATETDVAYLYALLAGRGMQVFVIPRSEMICDSIIERCETFWDCVKSDTWPDERLAPSMDTLKRMVRNDDPVELPGEVDDLLLQYDINKRAAKEHEHRATDLQRDILTALGGSESGTTPGGSVITYREQSRKGSWTLPLDCGLTSETLEFIGGKRRNPTSFRVMRVKSPS